MSHGYGFSLDASQDVYVLLFAYMYLYVTFKVVCARCVAFFRDSEEVCEVVEVF
jgi:hypothetical protein